MVMWLMPLTFATSDGGLIYLMMLFMILSGTAYNLWSKRFVIIPGLLLGSWITFLTLCGYVFFSSKFNWVVILLALAAFTQLWCQWVEGLMKDKEIDPHNLASILKPWLWEGFFWSSKVVQVAAIDVLFWYVRPDIPFALLAVLFIMLSVAIWGAIDFQRDRAKLLRLSGAHEILVFGAVVFVMSTILSWWAFVFLAIPMVNYLLVNRVLYGTFGRPKV
jgi:hypothetical protein